MKNIWTLACLFMMARPGIAIAQTVFWAEFNPVFPQPTQGRVKVARPDTCPGVTSTIAEAGLRGPWDVAVDPAGGKIYWSDVVQDKLYRANLDGTDAEILAQHNNPRGVKLDLANGKLYWSTSNSPFVIRRANLDGSANELLLDLGPSQVNWIDLDVTNGHIYYTDANFGTIRRCNLDGTNDQECLGGRSAPHGIAVDPDTGRVYWAESGNQTIFQGDLGCPVTGVASCLTATLTYSPDVELDVPAGRIYWSEWDGGTGRRIRRAELCNQSSAVTLISTADIPGGIAISSVDVPVCVPAASTWGLVALSLLMIAVGTTIVRRQVRGSARL